MPSEANSRPPLPPVQATPNVAAIELRGLDHVVLRVSDVDRAIAFYCDALGCHVERRLDALGLIQLRAGSALIDLVDVASPLGQAGGDSPAPSARNMDHFALELANWDEGAIRSHLDEQGIEAGDAGERYGAGGFGPSIYLSDPDGNTVELKGPATHGLDGQRPS